MERIGAAFSVDANQLLDPILDLGLGGRERRMRNVHRIQFGRSDVVGNGVRQDEIPVGETLHQRARAEPVGAVVREVRFTAHEQSRDGRHQVVVHPQPAHRVMRSGINPHRHGVRILIRDPLINFEQVAVLLANGFQTEPVNGIGEIKIDTLSVRPDAAPFITHFLGVA